MSRRYQLTLLGTGISVPVEGDKPIRGFFTIRRVLADTPEDVERRAIATLEREDRFRGLVETTERELGMTARGKVWLYPDGGIKHSDMRNYQTVLFDER
jgi:hypothetical protein